MFIVTTAIQKLLQMTARKKVIQGGTSSGKTYGIIPVLIDRCTKKKLKCTVVAETLPAVREGALDIFKSVMFDTGRWIDSHWNASSLTYTFSNGSRIQFKSFDSVGKAKASGKRDILFLNECNHIPFLIADALMTRSNEVWMDFNPDNEFWAHTETLKEPNSEFLLLLWNDNEALPDEIKEEIQIKINKAFHDTSLSYPEIMNESNIKNSFWANWCKVYVYGQIGSLEGVVFPNINIVDSIPIGAKLLGYGMDFGFTSDPTTLIGVYEYNNEYYFDEVIYRTGLLNSHIYDLAIKNNINQSVVIYADCAEPKTIEDLKQRGLKIVGLPKVSINFGISEIQEKQINVTSKSINLIKEFRMYKWAFDRLGNPLGVPIDDYNHGIDAIRYYFNSKKPPTKKVKVRRR